MLLGLGACNEDFSQPPVPELVGGPAGTGEWNNPMTAYQAQLGSVNSKLTLQPWVKGVIVGFVDTQIGSAISYESGRIANPSETDEDFKATINTNLIIALSREYLETIPEEERWENVVTVQLPSGGVRDALNLVSHPDNLWKEVCIQGTTGEKYCGVYGLRDCVDYNWGNIGKETVIVEPIAASGPFYQNFDQYPKIADYEAMGWKNVMVSGGLSGWYIKEFSGNQYITTSAYLGKENGGPYENWLISPSIDMAKLETKTLEFTTQSSFQAEDCYLEVYVMTSDNPKESTNTKLDARIATPPASGYSSWVNSGKLDLSRFTGEIYIGWKYYAAKGGQGFSTTYCIDDVNVGNASTETPVEPSGDDLYTMLKDTDTSCDWTFENVSLEGVSYVWSWKQYNGKYYLNASAFNNNTNNPAVAYAYSPSLSLAGVNGASVEFDHAAKFQNTIQNLGRFVIREVGTTEWTEIVIPNWPAAGGWTFASSGKIDISAFDGKEVELGFKYESTTAGADTWEIKNVKVSGTK